MPTDNKATLQDYVDSVLNDSNTAILDVYLDDAVVAHNPWPGQQPGVDGWRDALMEFREAFPDCIYKIENIASDGDKVTMRYSVTGLQKLFYQGVTPTGKSVTVRSEATYRFKNGRIIEAWEKFESPGLMEQLGKK